MGSETPTLSDNRNICRSDWLLLGISFLAAVPRVYLGSTQFIEYDGYWHVFIAMQDNWENFTRDYLANFHPPLFYLLLKGALWFGRTAIVYRSISILTGVAAVFVIGKIAQRLSLWTYTPPIIALTFGLALPSIVISCEVRSYMLALLFVLASFYCFLDLLGRTPAAALKSRALFAACAVLGLYSHYCVFFYVFACGIAALLFRLIQARRSLLKMLLLEVATFAPAAGVLAYLYWGHAGEHAIRAGHLLPYYFQPSGGESVFSFLIRNGHYLFNLFSPAPLVAAKLFPAVLTVLAGLGLLALYLIRELRRPQNLAAAATLATFLLILASIIGAAIAGKYPFGGELRQQFLLFPFVILCGSILLDRIAVRVHEARAASIIAAAAALVITTTSAAAFAKYPKVKTMLGATQMAQFREVVPAPAAVYLDQFDLITFFMHHHNWDWEFLNDSRAPPGIGIYEICRKNQEMLVFRDIWRWSLDFGEEALYKDFAACLRWRAIPTLAVFWNRQGNAAITMQEQYPIARQIVSMAARENLCTNKLAVKDHGVYFELSRGPCKDGVESAIHCAQCDDSDWRIVYSGKWTRGEFEKAAGGSLTYSDETGAAARAMFGGTSIQYVYTKAYNRGRAAVIIDGRQAGIVDLYSPEIEWQSSTTFSGLKAGNHEIEIRVLGRHRRESDGSFIDVDALRRP